jgi:uncharacterized protein (TIGR00725 family)
MKKPRYKIAVAGAIESGGASLDALEKAKHVGRAIASRGHFLVTGSHHGFPMFSAMGAKKAGGNVIYFSPAASKEEHVDVYRLDHDNADLVVYTGFGHGGAGIFLARSADAVIIGCGKLDALHEFNLALKSGKPVGVLKGDWEEDEVMKKVLGENPRSHQPVIFEEDPDKLIDRLLEMVIKQ